MSEHTKGPWHIESDGDDILIIGRPNWPCTRNGVEGEWDVATITYLHEDNKTEMLANANLIAAAPLLLEACRNLVEWHGTRDNHEKLLKPADQDPEIRDAMISIAKAGALQWVR